MWATKKAVLSQRRQLWISSVCARPKDNGFVSVAPSGNAENTFVPLLISPFASLSVVAVQSRDL